MSYKRWKLTVKAGGKDHEKVVRAGTLEMAAWGLKNMLEDLEDAGAFRSGEEMDASVRCIGEVAT